jgi:acyl-CoA dehydrogenase
MVAAMAVGIGRAVLDEARRFARERFSGASAHRVSAARDRLARIARKLDAGRLLAWRAAWLADRQEPNVVEASMAKAFCATAAMDAAGLGLAVLGAAGCSSDYLIEKLLRDVKALDIVEGTGEIQRIVIARRLIGHGDAERGGG